LVAWTSQPPWPRLFIPGRVAFRPHDDALASLFSEEGVLQLLRVLGTNLAQLDLFRNVAGDLAFYGLLERLSWCGLVVALRLAKEPSKFPKTPGEFL
jgi:hypothetical protein